MADGLDPHIVQDLDDVSAANENAIVQPLPENRKRPRPAPICVTAGSFILCLIVQLGSQVSGSACAEGKYAVGLCLTRWQHASAPYPDSMDWLIKLEKSRSRCQESFGYITYPIFKFAKFEPCEMPPQSTAQHIMQLVRGVLASELQHDGVFDYTMAPVGQIVDRWLSGLRSAKAPRFVTFAARPYYVSRVIASPSMLHIVTLSRKITRRLLLESKYPSAWHLKGIIDNVAGTLRQKAMAAPQPTESESRLGAIGDKHPADMVLRWLEASSFVKRQQQIWEASNAFSTIFAVSNGVSVASVIGQCRHMSGEVLRKARVRLDIVAMLFFRHIWKTFAEVDIYLYIDSSPQARGLEMFAVSMDFFHRGPATSWERRLLPLISLDRDYLDQIGKSLALMWIIFLIVGPSAEQVIRFCDRVRCIVSDM